MNRAESYNATSGAESIYMADITFKFIKDPIYYENEIRVYSREIEMNSNVSKEYDMERRYMLWETQRLYEVALSNYRR